MCLIFEVNSFWTNMLVPKNKLEKRVCELFGADSNEISDRQEAKKILNHVLSELQKKIYNRIVEENSFDIFMKLFFIFDEVFPEYLREKQIRSELNNLGINDSSLDVLEENRNIMLYIIDACNIWIENCVLYQHDTIAMIQSRGDSFNLDVDLLIDLFLYGFSSYGITLLTLSEKNVVKNFYGLAISPKENVPVNILKNSPSLYYNPLLVGNQDVLKKEVLTTNANNTVFGKGFYKTYGVEFLLFLAACNSIQKYELRGNEKSLIIMGKDAFVTLIEKCTTPSINGEKFYESFVLTKDKVKKRLRKNEPIVWKLGTDKERLEIKPFIELETGKVIVSYAVVEQAIQLWNSYFCNGGMCYVDVSDGLTEALNDLNKELSDELVEKIRNELRSHYQTSVDEINVKYYRIFGKREINYGDFDVFFFSESTNELFLIEAKYFSDSLNATGIINDYRKLFEKDGYYDHCRRRYDLVLSEPDKLKKYIGAEGDITVHLLFISSKPIELELQDEDGVVTFLSLNIFKKYLESKLISEDGKIMRPARKI